MIYKLDKQDITAYGVLPSPAEGGVAVTGVFDLPGRVGETERNWGDQIEPFVSAEDIRLGERTIGLKVVMPDLVNWENFRAACVECRLLGTELGDFQVVLAGGIQVEPVGGRLGQMDVHFLQTTVEIPELTLTGSRGNGYRLDDFQLERDFGIRVAGIKGDRDVPKRIEIGTTAPYPENRYRMRGTITLECCMQGSDLQTIAARMRQWHALCVLPGLRTLYLPDGRSRQVYIKDGFKVKIEDSRMVSFSLKMQAL